MNAQTQTQTEIEIDNDGDCPVCFNDADLETLCNHPICRGCAEEMEERRIYKCPLCREDMEDWFNERKAERDARINAASIESLETDLRRVLAELIIERDSTPPIPDGDIMVMFEQNHHLGVVERRIQGIQQVLANLEAERLEQALMGQEDINANLETEVEWFGEENNWEAEV